MLDFLWRNAIFAKRISDNSTNALSLTAHLLNTRAIILLFFALWSFSVGAQTLKWEEFLDKYLSEAFNSEGQRADELILLEEMHAHPLNINDCSREELLQIPTIGTAQADSILLFIQRHGPMVATGELNLIPVLDFECRSILPLFVQFGNASTPSSAPSLLQQIAHAQHEIASAVNIPFYKRQGFRTTNQPPRYVGSPLSGSVRYRLSYRQQLVIGFTGEQDDGEPFASHGNTAFDATSFYVLHHSTGLFNTWALGDYRVHFGKGLSIGIGYMNNAMSLVSSRHSHGTGIFAHTSTDESRFLRGAAATLSLGSFNVTLFGSVRRLDSRIENDSVSSILTSGYHRLPLELERKQNLQSTTAGGFVSYQIRQFHLGFATCFNHYKLPLTHSDQSYQRYYPKGNNFLNFSTSYSYERRQFSIGGETALSSSGALAAFHEIRFQGRSSRCYIHHRYFGKQYHAPQAYAYASSNKCRGEHGILLGYSGALPASLRLTTTLDAYRRTTPTYNAPTSPSNGYALQIQLEEKLPRLPWQLSLRYKLRSQQESTTKYPMLLYAMKHNLRFQSILNFNVLRLSTVVDGCYFKPAIGEIEKGYLVSQNISSTFAGFKLSTSLNAFHTSSYDAALYSYQPSLVYLHSYSGFYYHGYSTTITLQKTIDRHYDIGLKCTALHYTNQTHQGTAERTINSPNKFDLGIQFRWKM